MASRTGSPERDALGRALASVIGERGWSGASPALVAREAGFAPHEFYDHFRSLEQCYLTVYDRTLARLTRCAIRAVASQPLELGRAAWEQQLDAVMSAVLAFYSVEPALARTCLVEVLFAGPRARSRRDDALARFTGYVEGLRLSHDVPMPRLTAELIALGTADLLQTRVARGEAERLPELLPDLRDLWRGAITVQHDPELLAS